MNTFLPLENLKTKAISKRGGARIGAGRKPKLQFEARALFNVDIDRNWNLIMEKAWEAVRNGDKDMLKFLIEQRIGKPAQFLDVQKKEVSVQYTEFFKPEVREVITMLDNKIKEVLMKT